MLHLCTPDCSVSGGEVSVEGEVVHLRGKVAHPDGSVNLSWGQPGGVVVELESYWWIGVWNDLQREFPHQDLVGLEPAVLPFHPFYAWL